MGHTNWVVGEKNEGLNPDWLSLDQPGLSFDVPHLILPFNPDLHALGIGLIAGD